MNLNLYKILSNLRLGSKAALVTVVSLLMVSIAFTVLFYNYHKKSSLHELEQRALALAGNLSYNSRYAVISNDYETLAGLMAGVVLEEDILRAFIVDKGNNIIATSEKSFLGHKIVAELVDTLFAPVWQPVLNTRIYRAISPVISEQRHLTNDESFLLSPEEGAPNGFQEKSGHAVKELLGYAVLDVSLDKLNSNLAHYLWRAVLIALIIGFVGAVAASLVVHKIVQPLQRLAEVTKEIARGDFGTTIPVRRTDEIGSLAESFNNMTLQLKKSREDYKALNREVERKVAESTKELRDKYMDLEQTIKTMSTKDSTQNDFLAVMSHEMRTPLTAIQLFSEMMLQDLGKTETDKADSLGTIINNCQRLSRMIDEVLDCMKLESGKMKFHCVNFDLVATVDETLHMLAPTIKRKELKCNLYHQDDKLAICSDRDRVIQVLINVVSNSIKYSRKGGVIDIYLEDLPESVEIVVSDQGKGIKREELKKVFDKFNTLQKFQYNLKSSGLGMYLSKSIVEGLGGSIGIESQLGKGTTVHFTLAQNGDKMIQ